MISVYVYFYGGWNKARMGVGVVYVVMSLATLVVPYLMYGKYLGINLALSGLQIYSSISPISPSS